MGLVAQRDQQSLLKMPRTLLQISDDNLPCHAEYLHRLNCFIFDLQGNLLVNIGSSSDRCEKKVSLAGCKVCIEGAIRRYRYNKV